MIKQKLAHLATKKAKTLFSARKILKQPNLVANRRKPFFRFEKKKKLVTSQQKSEQILIFREIRLKTALFSANKGEHVFGAIKLK